MKAESKYNIGEKLVCKIGYTDFYYSPNYGGVAYKDGKLYNFLTVKGISYDDKFGSCYFFEEIENGIYEFALDSISEVRNTKINEVFKNEV